MTQNADIVWLQITVTTARTALAEAVFERHAAQAVTILGFGTEMAIEETPHAQPNFETARVVGLFDQATDPEPIAADLRATLGTEPEITIETLANQDWASAWLAAHPPLRFGRLWIAPHRAPIDAGEDAVVVRLDPGLAFGTGTHATTALCLEWLAAADLAGARVLDYGCGSGILAIAAARLGAAAVTAVDIDVQALRATRDNAKRNGMGLRITTPTIETLAGSAFDIVLANILAGPLIALAPKLTRHAAPGASLVLSGLLTRHIDAVCRAYDSAFIFDAPAVRDGWVRLGGHRHAD